MPKTIRREEHEPEDFHIGARMRKARLARGLRLEDLAEQMGIKSYQQLQKYETGANRISAVMLYKIAQHLGVQTDYFYAGLPDPVTKKPIVAFEAHVLKIALQISALDPEMMECVSMIVSRVGHEKLNA